MEQKQRFGGLDRFKFIAAFLVVAIHTSPLSSFSANADMLGAEDRETMLR